MANLIDIRRRIKSTKNTQQITKAMKMVSASRLRRASERATNARPYAQRIFEVHNSVLNRLSDLAEPLYRQAEGKTLVVALGGDKGLCGSFNANIFKQAQKIRDRLGDENLAFLPIGKKAVAHFKKLPVTMVEGYSDIYRGLDFSTAEDVARRIVDLFLDGEYTQIVLLFNKFKNVLVQDVTETQVLPLVGEQADDEQSEASGSEHLAEPGLREILAELAPKVVMIQVFQALQESNASEHAARMTAMDSATKNAKEMIEKLTLEMNKARQAAITKELIEVVSGAAAL